MKNKWILSLLAVLLMTAMLLPLASCAPSGQAGTETPVVTTAEPVPPSTPQGDLSEMVSCRFKVINEYIYNSLVEAALNGDDLSSETAQPILPICQVESKDELKAFQPPAGFGQSIFHIILGSVDESVFEENALLLVGIRSDAVSIKFDFHSLTRQDRKLDARFLQRYYIGEATGDETFRLGLLTVPKSALLGVNDYDALLEYEEPLPDPLAELVPHTEAMLALIEKCKNFDEDWMEKIRDVLGDVYVGDQVRVGDTYRIFIQFEEVLADEEVIQMMAEAGVEKEIRPHLIGKDQYCGFYATAEQIEAIAKNNVEKIKMIMLNRTLYVDHG